MRTKDIDGILLGTITVIIAASLSLRACTAEAQDTGPRGERLTRHLVLARLCLHEASMPLGVDENGDGTVDRYVRRHRPEVTWGDDCWLIHQVLLRGAQRLIESGVHLSEEQAYVSYAISYSAGRLLEPRQGDANAWAVYIVPGSERPEHWPRMRWSADAWMYVWLLTGGIVRTTLEDFDGPLALWRCEEPVHDWAGAMDGSWARSHGRVAVECDGDTANTAYVRPHLR